MKKQIKSYKYLQQFLVVFGLFIIFSTVITAQNTQKQIENRITLLDNEIKRLTYKRESIGLEFEAISNFSIQARPILAGYNEIVEAIKLKDNEISNTFWKPELREKKEVEYQSLIAQRDNYLRQFRNGNGVMGVFGYNSNTIGDLQNEWQKIVNYYKDKKREYDDLALELGNLNTERINLETELDALGYTKNVGRRQYLAGCWNLRTGKYISTITVVQVTDLSYEGTLTVNNLEGYYDNQEMFYVTRESEDSFRGTEYTWSKPDKNGNIRQIAISMKITINSDGNFLTWTSDETATMQRCNN